MILNEKNIPELFFHVGLERTGTKFLQKEVFPNFKQIQYISRKDFKTWPHHVASSTFSRILISKEFGKLFKEEVQRIANVSPSAFIIIVLRRQDEWIASQYKRAVKNGYLDSFDMFFNTENEFGRYKKEELFFYEKILFLEKMFRDKPFVLFHSELESSPVEFIHRLAAIIGIPEPGITRFTRRHASYTEKQLIFLQRVNRYLFGKLQSSRKLNHDDKWIRLGKVIVKYPVLYTIQILSYFLRCTGSLIQPETLGYIREFYADDWEKCCRF